MDDGTRPQNFIIATLLLFLILILWQYLFFKNAPQKTQQTQQSAVVKTQDSLKSQSELASQMGVEAPSIDTLFKVETPLYSATFSTDGGLISYKIKKVGTLNDIELLENRTIAWGEQNIRYKTTTSTYNLEVKSSPVKVTLLSEDGTVSKTLTFYPDKYLYDVKLSGSTEPITYFKGKLKFTQKNLKQETLFYSYLLRLKNTVKIPVAKLKEKREYELSEVTWFGVRTKYFFTGVLNLKNPGKLAISKDEILFAINSKSFIVYFGPLDYNILKKNHPSLASAFDFGSTIIKPFSFLIYILMQLLHKFIPNYGLVIIVFALLMKIAFFPLTRKQIIAAKRMQELKPKLETLQKVYKDNPQKLQQEMMELYKKYNVNPFSGCLTLIIQMPIFFALYQILTNSISLKGAPFILWIKDLSEKDPYYILPILMGVTSIILSSIQQAATDPQSKMLMYMMPVLFVIIFISLPSGIVLYWLTFNILGILEALLIKRLEGRHGT